MTQREALTHLPVPLVLLAAVFIAGSCAGEHGFGPPEYTVKPAVDRAEPAASPPVDLVFPPASSVSTAGRQGSSTTIVKLMGEDNIKSSGALNYQPDGSSDFVIVSDTANPLAWVIFEVDAPAGQRPVAMQLKVKPAGESALQFEYWCAVSNYTRYSWEWWGPLSAAGAIRLNSAELRDRYVSSNDELYIVVLAATGQDSTALPSPPASNAARIQQITVTHLPVTDSEYYSTRPHYVLLSSVTELAGEPPGLQLTWEHVTDSASPANEAAKYHVFRLGPGDPNRLVLGAVVAPEMSYLDPASNSEQVVELIPGLHYTYFLKAVNSAGATPADSIRTQLRPEIPGQHQAAITGYEILFANAAGGLLPSGELFGAAATAGAIQANAETSLELASIIGELDGAPFIGSRPATWPPELTAELYAEARIAASEAMYWHIQNAAAVGSRRCSNWLVLASGTFPITGNPGPATVFPDYDPESNAVCPEGLVLTYLPSSLEWPYSSSNDMRVHVVHELQYSVDMDVMPDPAAPELLSYLTPAGEPLEKLYVDRPTELLIDFHWGNSGPPLPLESVCMEVHRILSNGLSSGSVYDLQYVNSNPSIGEFEFLLDPHRQLVHCVISGALLANSAEYSFRLMANSKWSTINLPSDMLSAVEYGPPSEVVAFPIQCGSNTDELQILRAEPLIRRDSGVTFNFDSGFIEPIDVLGFYDALKPTGDEFLVSYSNGFYPRVGVIEGTNPDLIHSLEDCLPGISTFTQNPNKLWVDISTLTPAGSPGDPVRTYSFRVFNEDGSSDGSGTFTVRPGAINLDTAQGIAWGVNAFNRTDRQLSERDYSDHEIDADTVFWGSPMPDVLWFEVRNGWLFDSSQNASSVYPTLEAAGTNDLLILLKDCQSGEQCYISVSARIALPGEAAEYVAIHALTPLAFANPAEPEWPGILEPGHEYILALDDPHWSGIEYEFPDVLAIAGLNPNG